MAHQNETIFYARDGEYVTLDGRSYIGPYHKMTSDILMTGASHSDDSEVIVATAGRQSVKSSPLQNPTPNTTLNENTTQYDLLPQLVNSPPVIIKSIGEASTPRVKPAAAAGTLDGEYMYQFPDGTVKVHAGTTITMRIDADQPEIFNVENGILELKEPEEDLVYRWFVDGESIVSDDIDFSLRAQRTVSGSTLTITNMIPKYAGLYTCVASNDVGSTDGGSLNLEVYNSDVDSFFYTNLVTNPNGINEDGALGIDGWESLSGTMQAKQLSKKTVGFRDKRIVVDPMNPDFHWTKEMMFPRPYQLDGGVLQNNPINNMKSYFTRDKYQYRVNGGTGLAQIYQDIDIEPLREFVRGSIYGVSGVTALISFYLGNAIYSYEPARPYLTPDERAVAGNYYDGAPRLGIENYVKMGPGFVKETAQIQIEEYNNETRLSSLGYGNRPINITDPWNRRFGQYANQIYYEGGQGITSPDQPSEGGKIDQHLFVADELFPNPEDRYTYGQYAEFRRIVLDKLNPRTNKIRLIYTIKASGNLEFILQELGINKYNVSDGIFELPGWNGSWQSGQLTKNSNAPQAADRPWEAVRLNYRASLPWPDSAQKRIPKQSLSRAFASGFNLTLIPTGPAQNNENALNGIYSRNTRVEGLVPGPIQPNAAPFDPLDTGIRDVSITFTMDANTNSLNIQVVSAKPYKPAELTQLPYSPGLLPFDTDSPTQYIASPIYNTKLQLTIPTLTQTYTSGDPASSNGPINPIYLSNGLNEGRYVQLSGGNYKPNGQTLNGTFQIKAPTYPITTYTITKDDRLTLYENITNETQLPLNETYPYWSTPSQALDTTNIIQNYGKVNNQFVEPIGSTEAQWKGTSRFIITIGVHNTNFGTKEEQSLHAIDNYYLEFDATQAVIHKDKNTAGNEVLPSLDDFERVPQTILDTLNSAPNSTDRKMLFGTDIDGQLPDGPTNVFQEEAAKLVDMEPLTLPIIDLDGDSNNVASIQLPDTLLTQPRQSGGLGVPVIPPPSASLNVVEGSQTLFQTNSGTNSTAYTYNLEQITEAVDTQLAIELEKLSPAAAQFVRFYNFDLPYNDPKQTTTLPLSAVYDGSTDDFLKLSVEERLQINQSRLRVPTSEDSLAMVLARRKNGLTKAYNSILTTGSLPNPSPLNETILTEANTIPTTASIFTTEDAEPDPAYKVVLYGVRPITAAPTQKQGVDVIIGTPLIGKVEGKDYTIKDISVANTGSLM